jgi:hypothetical protein
MAKLGFMVAVDSSFALGDLGRVAKVIDVAERLPSVRWSPMIDALVRQAKARLAAARGEPDEADALFGSAIERFGEIGSPFLLATALTYRAEWLEAQRRPEEAATARNEARSIFESLGATVWLDRLDAANSDASV